MKQGLAKTQTDHNRLAHFTRLVFAMRRAQKRVALYKLYNKPESEKIACEQAEQYEKSVDYMTEQLLGRL